MKLSKCRACGAPVSLFAKWCPECGARTLHPILGLAVAAVLLVAVLPILRLGNDSGTTEPVPPAQNAAALPAETPAQSSDLSGDESDSVFGPGIYTVGKDIDAGTYDCVAVSGFGVLRGDVAAFGEPGFVQTMGSNTTSVGGTSATVEGSPTYSNLTLTDGDVLYVEMGLNVEFVPS